MIKSVPLRSCSPPLLADIKDFQRTRLFKRVVCILTPGSSSSSSSSSSCSASRSSIPKLEPFSRTRLERVIKDPPLIEKIENELADYCSTLEGEESYSCWRAYFELKDLEKRSPKEDLVRLILQAGGLKSLIGCLHGIASIQKENKSGLGSAVPLNVGKERHRACPIPDGLPKSLEELEEEERARMPDSPFTRLLRTKGRLPAWYSLAPDHETD
ncbi:hypothetical protein K2173_001169 [Erythroxylum novogranatense]|uniref:CCG-binding protein 1 n=1 Tax=Erythroxylum novogranatense TaxID=1862640 RepID=A0AAV8TL17_9ROSI|nr:hypothetical protein K2173_001169 [Erythroxylum novogranatense]